MAQGAATCPSFSVSGTEATTCVTTVGSVLAAGVAGHYGVAELGGITALSSGQAQDTGAAEIAPVEARGAGGHIGDVHVRFTCRGEGVGVVPATGAVNRSHVSVLGYGGAYVDATLSGITVAGTTANTWDGEAEIVVGPFLAAGEGLSTNIGTAEALLNVIEAYGVCSLTNVGVASMLLPSFLAYGEPTASLMASGSVEINTITVLGTGYFGGPDIASILLDSFLCEGYGQADNRWSSYVMEHSRG